ncbi:MAG: hypothetical protein NNA18_05145 [Nitrospira sp.]|nr:hypothetical protein [Nitrospira sp.]
MNIWRGCLSFGLLTACTTPVWEHPTKGVAHFERERSECTRQATNEEMAIDPHGGASIPIRDRVEECLRGRGYVERQR